MCPVLSGLEFIKALRHPLAWQYGLHGRREFLGKQEVRLLRFCKERRGTISILTALTLPVLIGVMGLGFDISYRATVRSELQRAADVSALAGAAIYASTSNSSTALTTAADDIELNGFPIGTRTGDGVTTLTDTYGTYSATIGFASPGKISVTAQRIVPLMFTKMFLSATTQTVSATAIAQLSPRTGGSQSCALALNGLSSGITTSDNLTISGGKNTNIQMSGCDLRSDASTQFNGSPSVGVPQIAVSGTIGGQYTQDCAVGQTPCDQQSRSLPQVPDPFAATYANQLNVPETTTAQPSGTSFGPAPAGMAYNSLSFGSGTYNLAPGVYYVSGSVSFGANGTVNGTGVTFIMTGNLQAAGGSTLNLTAPGSGATAGLLFGSSSSGSSVAFSGTSTQNISGAIYMPNGSVTVTGNTNTTPTTSNCLISIAQSITFAGSSNFDASGCASLGVPTVYDLPAIARLIQ